MRNLIPIGSSYLSFAQSFLQYLPAYCYFYRYKVIFLHIDFFSPLKSSLTVEISLQVDA